MQQLFSLLSWCLFTAQHVSDVFPFIIRSSMTAVAASGFTFVSWWQPCCFRGRAGRPARPRTQHDYHHDTKVKPEAAAAVIELLMMGEETPETCWAVNKRQDNEMGNCCIWLVIYLNWKTLFRFILFTSLFSFIYNFCTHAVTKLNGKLWGYRNKILAYCSIIL
jgi:hypothetical protein